MFTITVTENYADRTHSCATIEEANTLFDQLCESADFLIVTLCQGTDVLQMHIGQ
jgi:hypothetical protein